MMKKENEELLYQALETEIGGVEIYTTALECVENSDLKKEWTKYLNQTKRHVEVVESVFADLGLDPEEETPGREVVRYIGESLVEAMNMALESGEPGQAQIVAAECVVFAETKDHMNWHLIGEIAKNEEEDAAKVLKAAYEKVEDEEDEHLYHSKGWARELWIESLGMPAVLPPPEEEKDVKTAIAAAKAEQARKGSLSKGAQG
jgi:rubrerythrin